MPIDKQPWTDETVMPWGKHKGTQLCEVPGSYLAWLIEQPWIKDWPGLYSYLKSIEDDLIAERADDDESAGGYTSYDEFREDFRGY
jgi:hypothetical protein